MTTKLREQASCNHERRKADSTTSLILRSVGSRFKTLVTKWQMPGS